MRLSPELGLFVWAFVDDWKAAMLGVGSLVSLFLNSILQLIYPKMPHIPEVALFIVSIVCVLVASYRIWQREHRKRLAQPLFAAKKELEALRRHWKKHEETFHKRNTVYIPLADPPGLNEWEEFNFNEYVDKRQMISEAECFTRTVERAYEALPFLRIPDIAKIGYVQNRNNLTGNDLDQRIQDVNTVLDQDIEKVRLGQRDPVPTGPSLLRRHPRM